jgi:hypothetical protein
MLNANMFLWQARGEAILYLSSNLAQTLERLSALACRTQILSMPKEDFREK